MQFLLDLNTSNLVILSVIILFTATIIIWQIVRKISQYANMSLEVPLVRAIIVSRCPEGATLLDIKRDYFDQMGRELVQGNDNYSLRKWIEQIEHVTTGYTNGQTVFFSNPQVQRHVTKLDQKDAFNQTSQQSSRNTSVYSNNSFGTPKTWRKSLIFRRNKLNHTSLERPQTPQNKSSFLCPPPPYAPKKAMDKDQSQTSDYFDHYDEDAECDQQTSEVSNMNISFLADRLCDVEGQVDAFLPEFYKCVLVGDNFFLNLAVMELGFRMVNHEHIFQSGFCVSGLTIAEATRNIEKIGSNKIVLLNVGSVDIIQGKELVDLICDMFRLIKVCDNHRITPILTTILPVVNCRVGNRVSVTDGFNEFLMRNPFNFPVIELHKLFLDTNGNVDLRCYQPSPRFVSGMRNPLVLWNCLGRQRVHKALTQELGSAILKILIK